jgi:hypothetical protein
MVHHITWETARYGLHDNHKASVCNICEHKRIGPTPGAEDTPRILLDWGFEHRLLPLGRGEEPKHGAAVASNLNMSSITCF